MATQLADILFFLIAAAIVVSQAFILRSTARGMRYAGARAAARAAAEPGTDPAVARDPAPATAPRGAALEWTYAIVPAIALALLLLFAWRAMHPDAVRVEGTAPPVGADA